MEQQNTYLIIANTPLKTRIIVASIGLAACFFGLPYLEEWLQMESGWGTYMCIAIGIILFPNQRWFRTSKLVDFIAFVFLFVIAITAIQTWLIPLIMPPKIFFLATSEEIRNQQLVLTLMGTALIPLVNAVIEWTMSFFE